MARHVSAAIAISILVSGCGGTTDDAAKQIQKAADEIQKSVGSGSARGLQGVSKGLRTWPKA